MPCPVCSGAERDPIAPGLYRCTTRVSTDSVRQRPAPGRPWMSEPVGSHELVPCGHEYMEGPTTATELCRCGTHSIGICGDCQRPVCGNCSRTVAGLRLCTDDVRRRGEAIRAAEEAERRRHEEWASGVDPMDPAEAFTLLYLEPEPDERQVTSAAAALRTLSPAEYTSVAVDALTRSGVAPTTRKLSYRKKTGFMQKEPPEVRAWRFDVHVRTPHDDTSGRLWVSTEGRWVDDSSSGSGWQASSSFATTELAPADRDDLIDNRAEQIRAWLRGGGTVRAGVSGSGR